MVLSKRLVPDTSALLTLSPPLDFRIALQIIHSSSTDMTPICLSSCFILIDIILITSSHDLHKSIMALLASEFTMKDLGPLSYFLGTFVTRHAGRIFPSQSIYASDFIARVDMALCKPSATPVVTKQKLSTTDGTSYDDTTLYQSSARFLQYLTFTRPDISYVVR